MKLKPWITFQEKIQYEFKLSHLLMEALTHKSYAHESLPPSELFAHNERLEFLGDAVLDLSISHLLMMQDFAASEGELSKRRASLVNEQTLADVARELGISEYLILGRGEIHSQGHDKNSILSSALEAVLGSVFIDGGFDAAAKIVERLFETQIKDIKTSQRYRDYKTQLQELIQSKHKMAPQYVIEKTTGPEHQKVFQVAIVLGPKKISTGIGRSRKEAEQDAARSVLNSGVLEGLVLDKINGGENAI
jgi:ribonuclease III